MLGNHRSRFSFLSIARIAAVGPSTAAAVRDAGLSVAIIPDSYVAESLVDALLKIRREVSGHDFSHAEEAVVLKRHDFSRAVNTHQKKGL